MTPSLVLRPLGTRSQAEHNQIKEGEFSYYYPEAFLHFTTNKLIQTPHDVFVASANQLKVDWQMQPLKNTSKSRLSAYSRFSRKVKRTKNGFLLESLKKKIAKQGRGSD